MTGAVVLVVRLIAAAALYAFLGLALWIMWQELRQAASLASPRRIPPIRLEVRGRGQKSFVRLYSQPEVVLGRDPLSDLALTDKAVSARHARLSFHDGHWWVEDLKSMNGTRLNRERVVTSTVLTTGDEVKCGGVKVLITLPEDADLAHSLEGGIHDRAD
jgi:hypothetical protein